MAALVASSSAAFVCFSNLSCCCLPVAACRRLSTRKNKRDSSEFIVRRLLDNCMEKLRCSCLLAIGLSPSGRTNILMFAVHQHLKRHLAGRSATWSLPSVFIRTHERRNFDFACHHALNEWYFRFRFFFFWSNNLFRFDFDGEIVLFWLKMSREFVTNWNVKNVTLDFF